MTVFVTGATGYIGRAVTDALHRAGHTILGLARSDKSAEQLSARGYAVHRGDLANPANLVEAARRADAVIHCAASDVDRAQRDRAAVEAMLGALKGSYAPFIYTSGLWVLGETGDQVADETAPVHPADFMAHVPAVEEQVLTTSGVEGTVIRPANVYGQGGGLPAQMMDEALERGTVRYVEPGDQRWPFIHIDDLAALYVRTLEAPSGTLLHASNGEAVPAREVARAASHAAGAAGATELWPLDDARKELGLIADALAMDQQVTSVRARERFGWTPSRPSVLEDIQSGIDIE